MSVVTDPRLSANAVRLHGFLNWFTWVNRGPVLLSTREIGEELSMSDPTVAKARKQLVDAGLLIAKRRGSFYELEALEPIEDSSVLESVSTKVSLVRSRARGSLLRAEKSERAKALSRPVGRKGPPNHPWNALVKATNADSIGERGTLAKALERIKKMWVRDNGPLPLKEVTDGGFVEDYEAPEQHALAWEIERRAHLYRRLMRGMTLTPQALATHWTRVVAEQPSMSEAERLVRRVHDRR